MLAALIITALLAFFTAACTDQFILSGTVTWHDTGGGAEGVSVILFNAADNATMDNTTTEDDYTIVTTDKDGKYTFTGLSAGSYIVYAALEGYTFDPANREVEVTGKTADIDFTAHEDDFEVPSNDPDNGTVYTGSYTDCSNGCLPGDNPCKTCCHDTFGPEVKLCTDNCGDEHDVCDDECDDKCYPPSLEQRECWDDCTAGCEEECGTCIMMCTYDIHMEFDCPDFMPPQECPYNCQTWNPAKRSCEGPANDECG